MTAVELTREQLREVVEQAAELELYLPDPFDEEADATEECSSALVLDYSGRAMYGAECLGLTAPGPSELARFVVALSRALADEPELLSEALADVRSDNFGVGAVYYLPRLAVEDPQHPEAAPVAAGQSPARAGTER